MSNITSVEENTTDSRQSFENTVFETFRGRSTKPEWSMERINAVIRLIEEFDAALETNQQRNSSHYYYAKHYEIVEDGGRKSLAQKRNHTDEKIVKIVPLEEYYDVLEEVHLSTGHAGRDKMLSALRDRYFIPTSAVSTFVKSCQTCQSKKKAGKRSPVPLTSPNDVFDNNRGLVKLIDMQSTPDDNYQWILHYSDRTTKFSFLRPLISNDAAEVAAVLLKIFLDIGGPAILVIENRREFTADVIKELASLWPTCKILNGRPVPEPAKPVAEIIKNEMTQWMKDNNSVNWAIGLYFVQFRINCSYNPQIQKTPYRLLFGCDPKEGFRLKGPADILSEIYTEEDLENKLKKKTLSYIEASLIETSNSSVNKVKYADPLSNVFEEEVLEPKSDNGVPAVLPEHSVQIKTEYDDALEDETMYDVITEVQIKSEVEETTVDEDTNEHTPPSSEAPSRSEDKLVPAPTINIELKKFKIEYNQPEEVKPEVLKVKRFRTVKCRCRESEIRCFSQRCICQRMKLACTKQCHDPLKCRNLCQ